MIRSILIFLLLALFIMYSCTESPQEFNWNNISDHKTLQKVFDEKEKYEMQIRYTQIDRDEFNVAHFTSHSFNVDTSLYFYPASTVKMPVAFLAVQRVNEIKAKGLNMNLNTTIQIDSIRPPQSSALIDSTSITGLPSIAHYINKVFVVSDNDAYNRLYEFCGQDYINAELQKRDIFTSSRIITRVGISGFTPKDNRYTNQIRFLDNQGKIILQQEEKYATGNYLQHLSKPFKGKGYYDVEIDSVVMKPFNMYDKNFITVKDLEASLQRIIFPDKFHESQQFNLTQSDYSFLYGSMSKYPSDYDYLKSNPENNYDGYVKFFIYGDTKEPIPDHIHIFNKVGFAYGYLTDCAYIFDTKNNIEFFLTATLLVNENQIFNDGNYEYEEIGIPFLAELGREIYAYELKREKEYKADFSKFFNQSN